MEIENGKDYKTYFMDNKVACFYASKIYWEDIEVLKIDD
jgi:hypothetical protein